MEKSCRVRVEILGRGFRLLSDDNADYLTRIAKMVDERMNRVIKENPQLTFDKAAILTALNFCDDFEKYKLGENQKSEEMDDVVRSQLVEYSKELSRATDMINKLEKELETIKKDSTVQIEKVRQEYEQKEKELLDMIEAM